MAMSTVSIHVFGDVPSSPLVGVMQDKIKNWRTSTLILSSILFLAAGIWFTGMLHSVHNSNKNWNTFHLFDDFLSFMQVSFFHMLIDITKITRLQRSSLTPQHLQLNIRQTKRLMVLPNHEPAYFIKSFMNFITFYGCTGPFSNSFHLICTIMLHSQYWPQLYMLEHCTATFFWREITESGLLSHHDIQLTKALKNFNYICRHLAILCEWTDLWYEYWKTNNLKKKTSCRYYTNDVKKYAWNVTLIRKLSDLKNTEES